MRLFLVRHAEAAPGDPDDLRPLTPGGRDTARELAARLAAEQPEAVLTSPLLRATSRRQRTQVVGVAGCGLGMADEEQAHGRRLLG